MAKTVLSFKDITKEFPGVRALKGITFSLKEGEVLALIGENGAGKSTLIKCLTGAYEPSFGEICLQNKAFRHLSPKLAKQMGIGAVYQEFNLVPDLPVVENIFMGNLPGKGIIVDYAAMLSLSKEIFNSFGVDIDPRMELKQLSPAMMQIVEIAKAIAQNLKILILDEPTAPLTTKETEILFDIIRKIKVKGVSVIYISHRLEEIFQICDRVVVMRDGEKVGERLVCETDRQELIRLMIGRELTNYFPQRRTCPTKEVILKTQGLWGNGSRDITFELHRGEILGFAGLVGAGRTELMSVLFCDAKREAGDVLVNGKPFNGKHPWHAIQRGIALLPEDRKQKGLLMDKSVSVNITLSSIKKFSRFGIINFSLEKEFVRIYCDKLAVKTPSLEQPVQYLSGGNQQKLIVAKWMVTDCDIIIFDEPTRGIDVGAKQEIYELIHQLVEEGRSVIIISSDFEELIGLADRIAVMSEGELVGFADKKDYDKEVLLDMASGKR